MKNIFLFLIITLSSAFVLSSSANAAGFEAGRIIDDTVFTNKSAMSAGDVQAFLNSKVSTCDTWGEQPSEFGGGTRRQWGEARGLYPPYTCLKDYSENSKSAAQIIYDVAQEFTINPQVLVVLLQKEQGLVTDTWPTSTQYKTATGYGCPDTAPCDSQYFGLTNQLRWSGRMFRAILNNSPTWYTPYVLGDNYIQYNPTASCGGSVVNIQNRSTQALYNYTPYQPNQGALDAGWGQAQCGAYGNRNFYLYFTSWFGSTSGKNYEAIVYKQSPYPTLHAGESKSLNIQIKNVGNWEWRDDTSVWNGLSPIHLAATGPINRTSMFSYGWPSGGRPNLTFSKVYEADGVTLAADQHVVKTGQIARFDFNITAPWTAQPGVYREYFQPVLEGNDGWNIGAVAWLDVTIIPTYSTTTVSQCAFPTMTQNSTYDCFFSYRNDGNINWYDDTSVPSGEKPIHLAASGPINRTSPFSSRWPSGGRPNLTFSKVYEADGVTLAADQHVVKTGQIARFDFSFTASNNLEVRDYREVFQPVIEGSSNWSMGGVSWIDIKLIKAQNSATFTEQSSFPALNKGESKPAFVLFKNSSNFEWKDDTSKVGNLSPIHLAATGPINRTSMFSYGWPSGGRPNLTFSKVYEADGVTLAADQHVVKTGQIARFDFNITAPWTAQPGVYRERFQFVAEGNGNWNVDGSLSWLDITIK